MQVGGNFELRKGKEFGPPEGRQDDNLLREGKKKGKII